MEGFVAPLQFQTNIFILGEIWGLKDLYSRAKTLLEVMQLHPTCVGPSCEHGFLALEWWSAPTDSTAFVWSEHWAWSSVLPLLFGWASVKEVCLISELLWIRRWETSSDISLEGPTPTPSGREMLRRGLIPRECLRCWRLSAPEATMAGDPEWIAIIGWGCSARPGLSEAGSRPPCSCPSREIWSSKLPSNPCLSSQVLLASPSGWHWSFCSRARRSCSCARLPKAWWEGGVVRVAALDCAMKEKENA